MQHVADIKPMPASESTFADLLKPLIEPGFRLALAMLHDPQAAEDAVQEASFIAWQKLGRLRDQDRLRAWFLGALHEHQRLQLRSLQRCGLIRLGTDLQRRGLRGHHGLGTYHDDLMYADDTFNGPVLIRACDVVTNVPVVFTGRYAVGPVVGSDSERQIGAVAQ